jgi:diguanylate cyclase (GGDEF)-like protein
MRYGIGFKLGLLLATFSLGAMGIVGYYAYASSRVTLLDAAQRDMLTATHVLGRSFKANIKKISDDTLMLARLPTTLQLAQEGIVTAGHQRWLADTMTAMMAVNSEYFQIRLIGAKDHGLELVRVDRADNTLLNITADELQEKAHYDYVFNTLVLKQGQIYLSDIRLNQELGSHAGLHQPTLRVATPVVDRTGKVLGLVVVNLDLNGLFDRLKSDLPEAYQLYLSNRFGDYLIHPNADQVFGFEQGRRILIQDVFEPVAGLISGEKTSMASIIAATSEAPLGLVASFVRLPFGGADDQRFVILGLTQPLQTIVESTQQAGLTMLRMIVALAALALLLAALVSRAVTGRLKPMVQAMALFSRTQVVTLLPYHRQDEIGLLACSLNDMQATVVATLKALNESQKNLKHLAQHDSLTGLPNRALFEDRLQQATAQTRRAQSHVALLFFDLDGFKSMNDRYGHHVGDLLLKEVARRIRDCVRTADTVGRLGGDEFVVLLSYVAHAQDAMRVAEKICIALHQPLALDDQQLVIAASVGVAICPEHGHDAQTLSQHADAAMYQAKAAGGNQVRLFGV